MPIAVYHGHKTPTQQQQKKWNWKSTDAMTIVMTGRTGFSKADQWRLSVPMAQTGPGHFLKIFDHCLIPLQGLFSGAISRYFCMKSHTNSLSEKKNRTSNFSHFTPQSVFFAHAVHFETFGLFYRICFRIIFMPLFVSYTTAGNQSLRSVSLERFVIKNIC